MVSNVDKVPTEHELPVRLCNYTDVYNNERMLALLAEKQAALISRAVTRGLDPDAPFKHSGLKWLGDIPGHWDIRRCASLFKEIDERNEPGLPLLNVSLNKYRGHTTGLFRQQDRVCCS